MVKDVLDYMKSELHDPMLQQSVGRIKEALEPSSRICISLEEKQMMACAFLLLQGIEVLVEILESPTILEGVVSAKAARLATTLSSFCRDLNRISLNRELVLNGLFVHWYGRCLLSAALTTGDNQPDGKRTFVRANRSAFLAHSRNCRRNNMC